MCDASNNLKDPSSAPSLLPTINDNSDLQHDDNQEEDQVEIEEPVSAGASPETTEPADEEEEST